MLASEAIYEHVYTWWDNSIKICLVILSIPCLLSLPSSLRNKTLIYVFFLYVVLIFWTLVKGSSFNMPTTIMLKLLPVLVFVQFMDYRQIDLLRITYNVLIILISLSLSFYVLFDLELLHVTPSQYIWELDDGYQYIYTDYLGIYYRWHRNRSVLGYDLISGNGLWHEPGAYQIYANLGLYLSLFVYDDSKKNNFKFLKTLLFIAAVISSTSTMGLLLLAILLLIKFLKEDYPFKPLLLFIIIIQVVSSALLLLSEKMVTGSYIERNANTSGGLSYFISSPIWGNDIGGEPLYSGILSYIVIWGVLGFIPFFILYKGVKENALGIDIYAHIALIAWYILCMLDENYAYYPLMFLIYGFCAFYKKNKYINPIVS